MERVFSKDSFWLLFWGLIASFTAWAFWHYTGEHGFQILTSTLLIALIIENRSLKKRINQYEQGDGSEEASEHDQENR